ncbi:hypothetical protein WQ54_18135 [Bacillus sp. SA1-12]|uniref:hypothetical protein n=1 Tax=Bacillus sp. SA1-12 TaxID=1455638 RepID=UPI0006273AB5|nr:hypothetical protein [Bacillus sp. SA1-12]KKI90849.1 hypothetical protein WQ54_18135 [Bacillus sp. SA1-12]
MDTVLYFCYTMIYLILFLIGVKLAKRRHNFISYSSFLLLVTFGLILDNLIIACGKFIGESPFLEIINITRYWVHGFITPTLIMFGWAMAKRVDISWTKTTRNECIFLFLTIGLVVFECIINMQKTFVPVYEYGVLRYVSQESSGPPLMVLIVVLTLLVISIYIVRKVRWIWMLVGVLIMILGSVIPIPIESSAITNAFELIFLCFLWLTNDKLAFRY